MISWITYCRIPDSQVADCCAYCVFRQRAQSLPPRPPDPHANNSSVAPAGLLRRHDMWKC
eukprot:10044389-Alexandrium_andersonii.AAC.1